MSQQPKNALGNTPSPFLVLSRLKLDTKREDGTAGTFTLTPGTVLPPGCVGEEIEGAVEASEGVEAVAGTKRYYMKVQESVPGANGEPINAKASVEPADLDDYTMPLGPLFGAFKIFLDGYLKEHFLVSGASSGGKKLLRELGASVDRAETSERDAASVDKALKFIVDALVSRASELAAKAGGRVDDGGVAVMDSGNGLDGEEKSLDTEESEIGEPWLLNVD